MSGEVRAPRGVPSQDSGIYGADAAPKETLLGVVSAAREDFDPAVVVSGTVDEVNSFIDAHPEHADAVRAAEAEGKGRKGILGDD